MSESITSWVSLSSGAISAEVDPHGAQLSVLQDELGRDLLWNGDPAIWTGRAPLLFPIVGALNGGKYRLGSKQYSLPRHGFARGRQFDVIDSAAAHATFRLKADQGTLEIYPFRFELDVHFTIADTTLTVTATVRNHGDEDMPASFGYHPAFRWPLPYGQFKASHYIEFAADEPTPIRRLDSAGLLAPESHPTPISRRRLVLTDHLFAEDVVILDPIRSRSVTYGAEGAPRLKVSYPDAPYLGLWTKPGADFICIEPWHGFADPEGFQGDFRKKPGIFVVEPGAEFRIAMAITVSTM